VPLSEIVLIVMGLLTVAMIVAEPTVAAIDLDSYAWSAPAFDFWRPVGEDFPRVDGKFSLECYKKAAFECLRQWAGEEAPKEALERLDRRVVQHPEAEDDPPTTCIGHPFQEIAVGMIRPHAVHDFPDDRQR